MTTSLPIGCCCLALLAAMPAAGDGNRLVQQLEAGKVSWVARVAPGALQVDGDPGDWGDGAPTRIDRSSGHVETGAVRDDDDLSADMRLARDDAWLYVLLDVRDDDVRGPNDGGQLYLNDGAELWFDWQRDSPAGPMGSAPDDYQIVVSCTSASGAPALAFYRNRRPDYLRSASTVASARTPGGYVLEARFPLDGFDGCDGRWAAFNVSLRDLDADKSGILVYCGQRHELLDHFGLLAFRPLEDADLKREVEAWRPVEAVAADRDARPDAPAAESAGSGIAAVEFVRPPGRTCERIEWRIALGPDVAFENPFDFREIELRAAITWPGGRRETVDGFFYRDGYGDWGEYASSVAMLDDESWRVRFAPTEQGAYRATFTVRDRTGREHPPVERSFVVRGRGGDGFIHPSPRDPACLEHDSGRPFFVLGAGIHNWPGRKNILYKYRMWMSDIAAFGGNAISINIENVGDSGFDLLPDNEGLYDYSMANARRLDLLLEDAERRGVYVVPCLLQNHIMRKNPWRDSPFSTHRGGPCESPAEFFANEAARAAVRNYIRYVVARWGYTPHILGFELINEVNYVEGYRHDFDSAVRWHREMADWFHRCDPNDHMVTACYGSSWQFMRAEILGAPEIDYVVGHKYGADLAGYWGEYIPRWVETFGKPVFGGEAGLKYPDAREVYKRRLDPQGMFLHNNTWISAVNRSSGPVFAWWPVMVLSPRDGLQHLRPLSRFVRDIDWPGEGFRFLRAAVWQSDALGTTEDHVARTSIEWGRHPYDTFAFEGRSTRMSDRSALKADDPSSYDTIPTTVGGGAGPALIHGAGRADWRRPLTYRFDLQAPTEVVFSFGAVEPSGTTLVFASGDAVHERVAFGKHEGSRNFYRTQFERNVTLSLPAGRHDVRLTNEGAGWARLDGIRIRDHLPGGELTRVRLWGVAGRTVSLLWILDRDSTVEALKQGIRPGPRAGALVRLAGLTPGPARVQWWDTWHGEVRDEVDVDVDADGALVLPLPAFERDIAAKIFHRR